MKVKGPREVKGPQHVKGPMKVKGPREVKGPIACITLSMVAVRNVSLEWSKGVGKGKRRVLIKTNFRDGLHRCIGGVTQVCVGL